MRRRFFVYEDELNPGLQGTESVIQIISTIQIYRPIKQVFDFISNPENDFQWQYGTLASAPLSEEAAGTGACFQSTALFMGQRVQSTFEVTEFEPGSRYGFKSLSGPLQSFTSFALSIARGSTLVRMSLEANVVNWLETNENVLEKKIKRQIRENLAMLKNVLEAT